MGELNISRLKKIFKWFFLASTIASIIPVGITYFSNRIVKEIFANGTIVSENMQQIEQKSLISFSLTLLFFFSLLCLTLGTFFCTNHKQWWIISILLALASFSELSFVWYLVYNRGYYIPEHYTPLESKLERDALVNAMQKNAKNPFITIPTGLYIEYMFFTRKDNDVYPGIVINGIVWQRYNNDISNDINQGIILPDASQLRIKEIFHHKRENEEVIGWQFSALMFQHFDLSKFPFDHRHIKIKLLAKDFEKNVILVPDFESLESTNPADLPGINSFLIMPHWFLNKSFYTYRLQNLGTNFGNKTFNNKEFPQLFYYTMAHRNLWDTAIIYFILLLAAAVILFISLLAFLKHEVLTGLLGFSTIGILGVCSSLLFVLISSHIEMRENIAIDGTAYLEYLYVILYIFIILMALNSILFTLHEKITLVQYQNNFMVKWLYWPVLIDALLLVTVFIFY